MYIYVHNLYCRNPLVPHKKIIDQEEVQEILRRHLRDVLPPSSEEDVIQRINIRRSSPFSDGVSQFGRKSFTLLQPFQISFVGEPGVDTGGLKREFYRLFVEDICHRQGNKFFQAEQGLVPLLNYDGVRNYHYEVIGKIIGSSIFLGGTAPQIFIDPVVDFLIFEKVNHAPTVDHIPDYEIRQKLEVVSYSVTIVCV